MSRILKFEGELLKTAVNEIIRGSELQGIPWTRFVELNRLLRGFRSQEMTVLSGHTGTGKTTFLCEYSLDLAEQGVKTLWGSFEMPLRKICRTLLQQFSGETLASISSERVMEWAHMFKRHVPIYFLNLQGPQNEADVLKVMLAGVKNHGIQHIVLDNIQFLLGSNGTHFEERFQRQDKLVQQLRGFANQHGTHITMVVHPRKEDISRQLTVASLYGGGKVSQEADNVMLLQTEVDTAYPKKYIQLVKNRYDGTLGRFDLCFHRERLAYRPQPRQLVYHAKQDEAFTILPVATPESSFA